MADLITIQSDKLPSTSRVRVFSGVEAISKPYEFETHFLMSSEASREFDMDAALGADGSLSILYADGTARSVFHGIFSLVELVYELPGDSLYRAVLVPRFWQLTLTRHSRVFVNQSAPHIVASVLRAAGLSDDDFTLQLAKKYRALEHVCQYQESDFDFASRWMEREGMYYFFEQGEQRERLVITDSLSFQRDLTGNPVRYFPTIGRDVSTVEALRIFRCRHSSLPASVRLEDHDYLRPTLDVSGAAPVSPRGRGEISTHGENFTSPDDGRRLAGIRAQELLARQVRYQGEGRVFDLRPGYTFELQLDPRMLADPHGSFAPRFIGRKYLTTDLLHQGHQLAGEPALRSFLRVDSEDTYRVEVGAIPDNVQFRPERRTPTPRIYGVESATVDGDMDGDYAQLDEHGRYLVRIRFDEGDTIDGKASTRVRMLQPHGGNPEGWHFPLRKGTEVLLVFEGGDPDRPVIAGVVPDALTPSPVTVANRTRNVIHTGGGNRVEMEDAESGQYIKLMTPYQHTMLHLGARHNPRYNFQLSTSGDGLIATGNLDPGIANATNGTIVGTDPIPVPEADADVTPNGLAMLVGGNKKELVTGTVTETFKSTVSTTVTGDVMKHVTNGNVNEYYDHAVTTFVTGPVIEHYDYTQETYVKGLVTEGYGSQSTLIGGDPAAPHFQNTTVEGPVTEVYGSQSTTIAGDLNMTINGRWTVYNSDGMHTINPVDHTEIKGSEESVKILVNEFVPEHGEVVGIHLEAVIAHYELVGTHSEVVLLHTSYEGTSIEMKEVEVKVTGFKSETSTMSVSTALLHLLM